MDIKSCTILTVGLIAGPEKLIPACPFIKQEKPGIVLFRYRVSKRMIYDNICLNVGR
jgi:hypothetical protein